MCSNRHPIDEVIYAWEFPPLIKAGKYVSALVLVLLAGFAAAMPITAQETQPDTTTVTDNDVNAIAEKLYCPVCENIPLDTCGTAACADWRYEIRLQLEAGMTEDQIIDDFVYRFGDRVVGTPKSTAPRLLSLVTPWIAIAAALLFSIQFLQSRRQTETADASAGSKPPDATFRDLLEQDVTG